MLAGAGLARAVWGLLRGAAQGRPGGGTAALGSRLGAAERGGRGNGGVFCAGAAAGPSVRQQQHRHRHGQRLLRPPPAAWRLLSGGAGPGSGGAGPPERPRERRVAGAYAELVSDPGPAEGGCPGRCAGLPAAVCGGGEAAEPRGQRPVPRRQPEGHRRQPAGATAEPAAERGLWVCGWRCGCPGEAELMFSKRPCPCRLCKLQAPSRGRESFGAGAA